MAETRSDQLGDQILVALRRIIRATDLHSRQLLRQFGITGPQLLVLRAVGVAGELSGSALARSLSISLPTASDIAGRLEKRGLVVRRRDSADKRQVLISLTDAGNLILDTAPPPLQESFTTELGALEEWEQTQVLSVLQRVVAMMEAEALDASPVLAPGEIAAPEDATEYVEAGDLAELKHDLVENRAGEGGEPIPKLGSEPVGSDG